MNVKGMLKNHSGWGKTKHIPSSSNPKGGKLIFIGYILNHFTMQLVLQNIKKDNGK